MLIVLTARPVNDLSYELNVNFTTAVKYTRRVNFAQSIINEVLRLRWLIYLIVFVGPSLSNDPFGNLGFKNEANPPPPEIKADSRVRPNRANRVFNPLKLGPSDRFNVEFERSVSELISRVRRPAFVGRGGEIYY